MKNSLLILVMFMVYDLVGGDFHYKKSETSDSISYSWHEDATTKKQITLNKTTGKCVLIVCETRPSRISPSFNVRRDRSFCVSRDSFDAIDVAYLNDF